MGLKDGDFVLVEYTARVKETGNVFDTTNEEIAKKEGIYDSNKVYGPILVVIGRGWVIKGLEEALKEMNVGEEKEVEIPPEKAFGQRDPSKVKVFSMREFKRRGIDVKVGDVLDFGGTTGIVKSITGGRVVIDFNHPLAGKTLVYKVKILKKLEDITEKAKALVARHLSIKIDEAQVEYKPEEKTLVINIPTRIMTRKNIQYAKIALVGDIYDLLKDYVRKVVIQEVFERKTEEKKEETREEGKEEKETV
ncbi:FKBP-type peptidyl-prolyl cis-trans isomerase [Desulfurococcaceae archaeon MEX13E-LK6-19]|nr:FKBP-type peptidyl-prolyl cis-trans isomerase [Desulfurococcaceae archaeon MEX13E-LK6-19]